MLALRACVVISGGHWFLLPVSLLWTHNGESVEPKPGYRKLCAVISDSSVAPVLGSPGNDSNDSLLCA